MVRADAIGVVVADLARAIGFYRRLGLEFPADPDPEGHGHVRLVAAGGRAEDRARVPLRLACRG